MLLKDKVAIITGAASPRGIGKARHSIAEHGAKVAILDLDAEAAPAAAARKSAPDHIGVDCNVTAKADCDRAAKQSSSASDRSTSW